MKKGKALGFFFIKTNKKFNLNMRHHQQTTKRRYVREQKRKRQMVVF